MTTKIAITGMISGNFTLRNAIITANAVETKGAFNAIYLTFATKKEAVKALSMGYKAIVALDPQAKGKIGGIGYIPGSALTYDASAARILD